MTLTHPHYINLDIAPRSPLAHAKTEAKETMGRCPIPVHEADEV